MHTIWRVIFRGANFCGKSEKALRIKFHGFKFRDSNPVQGRGTYCTNDDVIDTHARSPLRFPCHKAAFA